MSDLSNAQIIVVIATLAVSTLAIAATLIRFWCLTARRKGENNAAKQLVILASSKDSEKIESAFDELVKSGYISVQTLQNTGNSYSDDRQSRLFGAALTPACMQALAKLKGVARGQHAF